MSIPDEYVDAFEAVCLQSFDDARERCGEALRWLELNGYVERLRPRRKPWISLNPLGIPVRLTAKGIEESKRRGLYNTTFAGEYRT